jgi:pilus assembly protein CpaE
LSLAGNKLHLVMNRANARVHLDIADVERALGITAEFRIPSDIAIPQAVNRGVPVVLDKPRAPAALALRAIADRYSPVASPPTETDAPPAPRRRGLFRER